jgi:hypothetical protein
MASSIEHTSSFEKHWTYFPIAPSHTIYAATFISLWENWTEQAGHIAKLFPLFPLTHKL